MMCKTYDQLRLGVAYSEANVKIVVSHGGISIGEDGVSQMSIEDVALAISLPKFVVMVPSDEQCTKAAIYAAGRPPGTRLHQDGTPEGAGRP